MTRPCRDVGRLLDAYLDSELEAPQVIEVDQHLQGCCTCSERVALDRAVRAGVRRDARTTRAPTSLRERAAIAMARAAAETPVPATDTMVEGPKLLPWRAVLPLAAAAAVPLALGIAGAWNEHTPKVGSTESPHASAKPAAVVDLDQMLDEFVDWHARPLPPEVTNETELVKFEPYVGVPLHAPALSPFGGRLIGGRILTAPEQHTAAMLYYTMPNGHRVSVYVYDPRRVPVQPTRLHARLLGHDQIFVGRVRGYSVAAPARKDVGYAIATDLDEDETTELAVAAAP
jgi:anti-sigma factor (TIGR02949 family)